MHFSTLPENVIKEKGVSKWNTGLNWVKKDQSALPEAVARSYSVNFA